MRLGSRRGVLLTTLRRSSSRRAVARRRLLARRLLARRRRREPCEVADHLRVIGTVQSLTRILQTKPRRIDVAEAADNGAARIDLDDPVVELVADERVAGGEPHRTCG